MSRRSSVRLQGQSLEDRRMLSTVFALTTTDLLLRFDSATPDTIQSSVPISGLQAGESLRGLDVRPATGEIYGIGSTDRLYRISSISGQATQVGPSPFLLLPALTATDFGVDISPILDQMRVVADDEHNFRLSLMNASVVGVDGSLAYAVGDANAGANPNVVGIAYSDNVAGAPATTLYGIDSTLDVLVTQGGVGGFPSPNTGKLSTVGSLGIDTNGLVGFDIQTGTNTAYASWTPPGSLSSSLGTVNLVDGSVTLIGAIGGGATIRDIALALNDGTPNQLFVAQIYRDLLGREADPVGMNTWAGLLETGGTRQQVVLQIEGTVEFLSRQVEAAYLDNLGRVADASGLNFWTSFLASGGTPEAMRAELLGSNEYFASSGGTNDAFLAALYLTVLGRPIDAGGQAFFSAQLAANQTRSEVALQVVYSAEAVNLAVQGWYLTYLRRAADPDGLAYFSAEVQQGTPDSQVVATLCASTEYADNLL